MSPHYLNIKNSDGSHATKWEHREVTSEGQSASRQFDVPRHLDPNNPRDCNWNGDCVVTNKFDKAFPRDFIFSGEPTPEMEPLDDEAEKITDDLRDKWIHPIESLPQTTAGILPPTKVSQAPRRA
jgi:hypothetical protein